MNAPGSTRLCDTCCETRPYPADFYDQRFRCKACTRADRKRARETWTPEQFDAARQRQQEYRERHRDRVRASNRASEDRRRGRMGDSEFRAYQAAATRRTAAKKRAIIRAAKDKPCIDCGGQFHPTAMDLHHRDAAGKEFNVSQMAFKRTEAILAEIDKCDVICANCHRIRHLGC